jgi:hypothetical protein
MTLSNSRSEVYGQDKVGIDACLRRDPGLGNLSPYRDGDESYPPSGSALVLEIIADTGIELMQLLVQ